MPTVGQHIEQYPHSHPLGNGPVPATDSVAVCPSAPRTVIRHVVVRDGDTRRVPGIGTSPIHSMISALTAFVTAHLTVALCPRSIEPGDTDRVTGHCRERPRPLPEPQPQWSERRSVRRPQKQKASKVPQESPIDPVHVEPFRNRARRLPEVPPRNEQVVQRVTS